MDPKEYNFKDIFHRTKKKIFNFVLKMTYDRMLTEDIVQNVFLKLFESLEKIEVPSSVDYWLFKTARNQVYQFYRTRKIHIDRFHTEDIIDIDLASDESIEDVVENADLRNYLEQQLMFMPIEQKEVFLLREYGGFSYKEISELLNIDVELVKSRLNKVRKKLIERISKIIN